MTRLLPFAAAAVAGAAVLASCLALLGATGESARPPARTAAASTWTAPGGTFSIATPPGWRAVARGPAATVLARADRRGVVVIRRRAAVREPLSAIARRLEGRLRRRMPGFRPTGARLATVGGAPGLVYTFARPDANQVQSIVVAPAGSSSYTLDLVADGDAPDVARELAGMVRSFAPHS